MSKRKTTTKQTNTYQYQAPPDTQDIQNYRNQINRAYDTPDSSIPYQFARMRETAKNRFNSPFGADVSPEVREAANYEDMNEIDQMQGQAVRNDMLNRQQAKIAALGGLAGLTSPNLVQTGGTSTTTQSSGILQSLIGAGAGIGQAALL